MKHDIDHLFNPKNVAIVGASSNPAKAGYAFLKELIFQGYTGKIYPINPKGGEICGLEIKRSLSDIEEDIELAIILVAPSRVLSAIEDCANHKVKVVIVYTAGFGETSKEGLEIQNQMVNAARASGMRLVGPNCMSVFSGSCGLNLTGIGGIPKGPIGVISQSGNVAITMWYEAAKYYGTGFSKFIGVGNQSDITFDEYLDYLKTDEETKVIVLYVEGFNENGGRRFLDVATKTAKVKPVIVLKGGRSNAGNRATQSHTGSLAGDNQIYSAAFRQSGVIEVSRFDELLPVAQTLASCPKLQTKKIAIVGSGGGHSIIGTDAVERQGLEAPPFTSSTTGEIDKLLPERAPKHNPIDMTGVFEEDLNLYSTLTDIVLQDPEIGGVLLYGTYGGWNPDLVTGHGDTYESVAKSIVDIACKSGKPVIMHSIYALEQLNCFQTLRDGGVPVFNSLEVAASCLNALYQHGENIKPRDSDKTFDDRRVNPASPQVRAILANGSSRKLRNLLEPEAMELLNEYNVNIPNFRLCSSKAEAAKLAAELGYPVVMKVVSPDILHKTDFGGVQVGLSSKKDVEEAYDCIVKSIQKKAPKATMVGMLLTPMIQEGVEMIVGMSRDKQFGTVIMVGMGGVFVEVYRDVVFGISPLLESDALEMISRVKGYPVLAGARSRKPKDITSLARLICNLAVMGDSIPEIKEVDLNPVFVKEEGIMIADARIIV